MGLDMYLYGEIYLSEYFSSKDMKYTIDKVMPGELQGLVKKVVFEVGYWRKANQVHRWFVENVQDGVDECQEYGITREHIEALKEACMEVLSTKVGKLDVAAEVMPTASGFFFGSTEYDEYYLEDMEHTVHVCDLALELLEKYPIMELSYHSSW